MDDLTEQDISERLGKSRRWVQQWLADDARRPVPLGQFHHYIGASKRWTEETYQALRAAVLNESAKRKGASTSIKKTGPGTSPAPFTLLDDRNALDNLLNYPLNGHRKSRKSGVSKRRP